MLARTQRARLSAARKSGQESSVRLAMSGELCRHLPAMAHLTILASSANP
jgi:hypothetical protein